MTAGIAMGEFYIISSCFTLAEKNKIEERSMCSMWFCARERESDMPLYTYDIV